MNPLAPSGDTPARRFDFRYVRTIRRRPRLYIGALIMVVAYFVLAPAGLREATRALVAWNAGGWSFLALVLTMMVRSPHDSVRDHAWLEDENPWVLLLVAILAATSAMAAIVWELGPVKDLTGLPKTGHIVLVAATILSAWTFIHVMFAIHYAGEYYAASDSEQIRGGLKFPGEDDPGWGEFLYQAFVIGCACATADVNTTTPAMRITCLAQGVVAFFFNTIILALTINIGASLF
jgi:uncharacterized membrane protein